MFKSDTSTQYSRITKVLHWGRLAFLLCLWVVIKMEYVNLHKAVGLIFFVFIVGSILWRFVNIYPSELKISTIERNIQMLIFIFIYFLLFTMPIIGYISSYSAIDFGLFSIPSVYQLQWVQSFFVNVLFIEPYNFRHLMKILHTDIMTVSLYILIGLHVLAVLFNQFMRKNNQIKNIM